MTAAETTAGPADDILEGPRFDSLYKTVIEPQLETLEQKRKAAVRLFLVILMVGAVPFVAELLFFPDVRLLLPTLVVALIVAYIPVGRVRMASKETVINALCAPLDILYAETKVTPPAFDTFLSLNLLPHPSGKAFQDSFSGRHGDFEFSFCQATLQQGSGKSRHVVFSGQIFRITTPRRLLGTTVVLRDSGWRDRFECPPGLQKVGLEDPQFNKIFAVFGSDQVEAREILDPVFMEQLFALEQTYAGEHVRCGFVGPDLLIAVEGPPRFEIGGMFTTLVDRGRVERIAGDIEAVFKLIDQFKRA
jgi:hypothetical protein